MQLGKQDQLTEALQRREQAKSVYNHRHSDVKKEIPKLRIAQHAGRTFFLPDLHDLSDAC
jgi:hypothetical protein